MRKPKIKIIYPKDFDIGQSIDFIITKSKGLIYKYRGDIRKDFDGYYINLRGEDNRMVFSKLNINPSTFYRQILDVYDIWGSWPYTKTLDQLKLIVKGLEHYNEM